jgi:PAS domain S-box-containing protein
VRNTARLHRNDKGEVLYLEGALEDVTEEVAARTDPGHGLRAAVEASRSGVALVNLDGLIIEANPAFAETFSHQGRQMEGLSLSELLEESDQPYFLRELGGLSRGERTHVHAERRFRSEDGSPFWARTTAMLLRDGSGQPGHVVLVLDVTA